MASSRDRDAWTHIFKLYKELPHLWDKNNTNYGNRSMMTDGYKLLTRVYRERLDKNASVGALRMKMKNLRTTYYRELRKLKTDVNYTPSLWYFENLNFLGKTKSNESTDRSENDNCEDSSIQIIEDLEPKDNLEFENSDIEYELLPSTSQIKATRRPEITTIINNQQDKEEHHNSPLMSHCKDGPLPVTGVYFKEERQTNNTDNRSVKDDRWEIIGKSIGYQLQDLDKKQYTIVSKLISDAIYFGRLKKLTEESHIQLNRSTRVDSNVQSENGMVLHLADVSPVANERNPLKQELRFIDEN